MEQIVKNIGQTKRFAKRFAKSLAGGETILLNGDLGAGKTTFTQFLAKYLGVKDVVSSPTFNIVKEYECGHGRKVYHFDMYRLESADELQEIGAEDILLNSENDIKIVEWPDKIDFPYKNPIVIIIEKTGDNSRVFRVKE